MPLAGDNLMAFGLRGHVFRSVDAGIHWQKLSSGTNATLADGLCLRDGRIVLAGLAGTVLLDQSGQGAFKKVPTAGRRGMWALVESPAGGLISFGERGAALLSLDSSNGTGDTSENAQ